MNMIVTPIAHTVFVNTPESVQGTPFHSRFDWITEHIDLLHEFAGRACYQSWDLPNEKTATNDGYMKNIIDQAHFSVLEHGSVTFYVEGVSRSLTHELIRHRHLSYSELSQRYVNVGEAEVVVPPAFQNDSPDLLPFDQLDVFDTIRETYGDLVDELEAKGLSRKRAREAARAVMPNCTETKIVVTGNLRAWRDMLHKRWHEAADAEIREFAGKVLGHLRDLAPASVQDIPDTPFS